MDKQLQQVEEQILEDVGVCLARVMDECELELESLAPERWLLLRPRLLKFFGHRGLEGRVRTAFDGVRNVGVSDV